MSDTMRYDEEPARRIAALSETIEMQAQRRRVIELLAPVQGELVLDVGCGPGHLVAELAEAVGARGSAQGADVSEQMIALSRRRGLDAAPIRGGRLPFEDASFDAAVATQVYEFVDGLPEALRELARVLRSGGRALILDTDWDTLVWRSSDDARMGRVLEGWRRRLADPHLPRRLAGCLRGVGLDVTDCEAHTILDRRGDPSSYSARQIEHLGASAVGVDHADVRAWAADLRALAAAGEYFFSLNRYIFLARKRPGDERALSVAG